MTTAPFFDEIVLRANRGMGKTAVGDVSRPRGERIWKSLTSTGSAFVKRIPGGGVQHSKQLAGQMAYVNGKAKGVFGFATGIVAEGDAFEQTDLDGVIAAWAQDWKGRPRNGHTSHMVLSFPDDVSENAALAISQQWCAEMFEDETHAPDSWEYVAVLHTDTANPHVHVILNNRGQDGAWFSISSAGVFNPQMLRDRMTDIADDFGIRLESLTRADRGLYRDPITSAAVFASREGRVLSTEAEIEKLSADWRREDMIRTAGIYTTLAEFAETIGASTIANRAFISASALSAGQDISKELATVIDLDVTADRDDIRTSLIEWADRNREQIEALPAVRRTEIMDRIDAALTMIETEAEPDLTEDTIWLAFSNTPSSYLIPDVGALQARAALYVPADKTDLLRAFAREKVLDAYLVTGEVPSRFAAVMPAVADAYAEMHSHRLADIPLEMTAYVQRGAALGLDPAVLRGRLIRRIDDPVETMRIERKDIAKIVMQRGDDLSDLAAVADASSDYREFQLALGEVEERIIAESRVYNRAGVAGILQDAASTAATTGRSDFAGSTVGREVLKAFVALEGRGAMKELARGDMEALSAYVDAPAHRRLAARELLTSAKSVDVGLEPAEIETGLEAVDPGYSRGRGYSI